MLTLTRSHSHIHTHTHRLTCSYSHVHSHTPMLTKSHTHAHMHVGILTHSHRCSHSTCSHTHMLTLTLTHTGMLELRAAQPYTWGLGGLWVVRKGLLGFEHHRQELSVNWTTSACLSFNLFLNTRSHVSHLLWNCRKSSAWWAWGPWEITSATGHVEATRLSIYTLCVCVCVCVCR